MKKYDIYLAGAIIMIALVWFLINLKLSENGRYACLYVDNRFIEKYDLSSDLEQPVYDDNGNEILKFIIKNKAADVVFAKCPDKLCVHQKAVSKAGETIVCLPQKIVIKIESDDVNNSGIDAVTY